MSYRHHPPTSDGKFYVSRNLYIRDDTGNDEGIPLRPKTLPNYQNTKHVDPAHHHKTMSYYHHLRRSEEKSYVSGTPGIRDGTRNDEGIPLRAQTLPNYENPRHVDPAHHDKRMAYYHHPWKSDGRLCVSQKTPHTRDNTDNGKGISVGDMTLCNRASISSVDSMKNKAPRMSVLTNKQRHDPSSLPPTSPESLDQSKRRISSGSLFYTNVLEKQSARNTTCDRDRNRADKVLRTTLAQVVMEIRDWQTVRRQIFISIHICCAVVIACHLCMCIFAALSYYADAIA